MLLHVQMIGQGLRGFFSEGFNVFDFFVVILAFVELIMVSRSGGGGSISALRCGGRLCSSNNVATACWLLYLQQGRIMT